VTLFVASDAVPLVTTVRIRDTTGPRSEA